MAVLGVINEALTGDAEADALSRAVLGPVIREGIANGLSGRSILQAYRLAGGSVADSVFWQLRQAVMITANAWGDTAALTTDPSALIAEMPGGQAGVYDLKFTVYMRNAPETGLPENTTITRTIRQKSGLNIDTAHQGMQNLINNSNNADYNAVGFELLRDHEVHGMSGPMRPPVHKSGTTRRHGRRGGGCISTPRRTRSSWRHRLGAHVAPRGDPL